METPKMYKGTVKSLFVILVYLSNNHNTHTHTHTHTRYKVTFTSFHKSFPGGSDCKESRAMQATQVQFLGWEDPLEKGMATHSCLENSMDRGACQATVHGFAKSQR